MNVQDLYSVLSLNNEQQIYFAHHGQTRVLGLTQDHRRVQPGFIFFAIRGSKNDGHQFIEDAIKNGAVGIVVERDLPNLLGLGVAVARVGSVNKALSQLATRFYSDPSKELFLVGVTGTNGKTSTSYISEHFLKNMGHKVGVIGTVDQHLGEQSFSTSLTTPDPLTLNHRLREFRVLGATSTVMEVSSHALQQRRVDGLDFNVAVFTNLSRDHLDYHSNMDEYFAAKARFFSDILARSSKSVKFAVVNVDQTWGRRIFIPDSVNLISFGRETADLQYKIIEQDNSEVVFELRARDFGVAKFRSPLIGEYNVANIVGSIGVALAAGAKIPDLQRALSSFVGVPGRMQKVPSLREVSIFVDYAHTPDALRQALSTLREVREKNRNINGDNLVAKNSKIGRGLSRDLGEEFIRVFDKDKDRDSNRENKRWDKGKIICLFGCGGNRDKGKRSLMGQVADELADKIIVTSDNPRDEEPQLIIEDIVGGINRKEEALIVPDRREAMRMALSLAEKGDFVLIAGKGHEDYQEIKGLRHKFSDWNIAKEIEETLC